jgi:hypothetical protein
VAGGAGCAGRAMGTAEEREVKEEKEQKNVGPGRGLRQYALAKRRDGGPVNHAGGGQRHGPINHVGGGQRHHRASSGRRRGG